MRWVFRFYGLPVPLPLRAKDHARNYTQHYPTRDGHKGAVLSLAQDGKENVAVHHAAKSIMQAFLLAKTHLTAGFRFLAQGC